jgi:hypothetical protein
MSSSASIEFAERLNEISDLQYKQRIQTEHLLDIILFHISPYKPKTFQQILTELHHSGSNISYLFDILLKQGRIISNKNENNKVVYSIPSTIFSRSSSPLP